MGHKAPAHPTLNTDADTAWIPEHLVTPWDRPALHTRNLPTDLLWAQQYSRFSNFKFCAALSIMDSFIFLTSLLSQLSVDNQPLALSEFLLQY